MVPWQTRATERLPLSPQQVQDLLQNPFFNFGVFSGSWFVFAYPVRADGVTPLQVDDTILPEQPVRLYCVPREHFQVANDAFNEASADFYDENGEYVDGAIERETDFNWLKWMDDYCVPCEPFGGDPVRC